MLRILFPKEGLTKLGKLIHVTKENPIFGRENLKEKMLRILFGLQNLKINQNITK